LVVAKVLCEKHFSRYWRLALRPIEVQIPSHVYRRAKCRYSINKCIG
jgi:hypothetical protein